MNQEDQEAIKEIIESIMSHSPEEIGLDQSRAEVLKSVLENDTGKYTRRVVEFLKTDGPSTYRNMAAIFGGDWGLTMDGIVKALGEGKIKFENGRYVFVEEK
jgi:hypothetical protein